MDSTSTHSSSLSLELRLIRARNIYMNTRREVFVRCYLTTESNKRVRIDSQQIPSHSNLTWNQTFSLKCVGNEETIKSLKQGTIVFELRFRSSTPFLAKISGSKLLARTEMRWGDVVGKPNMEIDEKWIVMIPKNKHVRIDDVKPPAVQIAMKVEELKKDNGRKSSSCDCMDCGCNYCADCELFALGTALEAF